MSANASADDVIFAIASGQGRAGVAVMRISGMRADEIFGSLFATAAPPLARTATLATLCDPDDGALLDRALVLWFPEPRSFTGENVVELHLHGGPAVIAGVTGALSQLSGFRPAEPGEFTRRAFLNGKLDLAEAEGLGDLIEADTSFARRRAMWQMGGGLSAIYERWSDELADISALAEAALDFSDEPVPDDLEDSVHARVEALALSFKEALARPKVQERIGDGLRVVLSGPPNVGKSSLLNRLAGRDAAIVTDIPGTTRDILEVRLDLGGYPVSIYDTAGLRETDDPVESEGVARALAAARDADLVVAMTIAGDEAPPLPNFAASIRFWSKADLCPGFEPADGISGSVVSGTGIDQLEDALTAAAKQAMEGDADPAITRARHRTALQDASAALERAIAAPAFELMAEDLRLARRALGRVTGAVDVEALLDRIFLSFCIGK